MLENGMLMSHLFDHQDVDAVELHKVAMSMLRWTWTSKATMSSNKITIVKTFEYLNGDNRTTRVSFRGKRDGGRDDFEPIRNEKEQKAWTKDKVNTLRNTLKRIHNSWNNEFSSGQEKMLVNLVNLVRYLLLPWQATEIWAGVWGNWL